MTAYSEWLNLLGLEDSNYTKEYFKNRYNRKWFREQLTKILPKYCKQIGIPTEHIPQLLMTKKEYVSVTGKLPPRNIIVLEE